METIFTKCHICGKDVKILPTQYSRLRRFRESGRAFCSRNCITVYANQKHLQQITKKMEEKYGKEMVCRNCGKVLQTKDIFLRDFPSRTMDGTLYCSKRCAEQARKRGISKHYRKKRVEEFGAVTPCGICGRPIPIEKIGQDAMQRIRDGGRAYCSKKCLSEVAYRRGNTYCRRHRAEIKNALKTMNITGNPPLNYSVPQITLLKELERMAPNEWELEFSIPLKRKWEKGYKGAYSVDLANPKKKIYVECDGKSHKLTKQKALDEKKKAKLAELGWRELRFWNEEIMENAAEIATKILSIV